VRKRLAGLLFLIGCAGESVDPSEDALVGPLEPPERDAPLAPAPPPPSAVLGTGPVSNLARYEQELASVNEGRWFSQDNNETGTLLGWGESYVMTSLVQLFEKTGDVRYLDHLAEHADSVLAQRDSARHVKDYRGLELPCWRSVAYTAKPYCFAVHTGMIAYPLVELAVNVKRSPSLGTHVTYDGKTLADKAAIYIQAGIDAAKVHDDEWRNNGADKGHYVFRPDATFYAQAGKVQPYNQMNGLGLVHVALAEATGDATHRDRARRLANTFLSGMKLDAATDSYTWNYWSVGTPKVEDVSHAALNLFFAWRAAESDIVFGDRHLDRLTRTVTRRIYVDTKTTNDQVGPGATNNPSMRPQVGRWGVLSDRAAAIAALTNDLLAPVATGKSGSHLMGRALLYGDWSIRPWTKSGNKLTLDLAGASKPALARIRYKATSKVVVRQADQTVAVLAPASDFTVAHLPYDPKLGAAPELLFANAIELDAPEPLSPPVITTTPPADGLEYQAAATSSIVTRWSVEGPATVDPWTGKVSIDSTPGPKHIVLRARNDYGTAEQAFDR
jgi:hypothetical protein